MTAPEIGATSFIAGGVQVGSSTLENNLPSDTFEDVLPDKPAVSQGQTPGLMEAKTKQPEHPIPRSQMAKYTAVHHRKGGSAATTGSVGNRETTFVIEASQEDVQRQSIYVKLEA